MIELNNITLKYGQGSEVLNNINLHIKPRSFHFITGPSGAGKSTLLKLIFLSLKPTRGTISLFGKDTTNLARNDLALMRRKIGFVFQDFRLLDHLTIFDNIALPFIIEGRKKYEYKSDVIDLLQWVDLGDRIYAYPSVLSGGEKQRAAIARAVIREPELILADEPTGNVDPQLARKLLRLFIELRKRGTTIMIATHDHHIMSEHEDAEILALRNKNIEYL